jgi:hypothetical protein
MSEKRTYDNWAGNPKGTPEDKTRCVESVCPPPYWHIYQCSRKRGFGLNGEYCKQHAKNHPVQFISKQEGGKQ